MTSLRQPGAARARTDVPLDECEVLLLRPDALEQGTLLGALTLVQERHLLEQLGPDRPLDGGFDGDLAGDIVLGVESGGCGRRRELWGRHRTRRKGAAHFLNMLEKRVVVQSVCREQSEAEVETGARWGRARRQRTESRGRRELSLAALNHHPPSCPSRLSRSPSHREASQLTPRSL